jgi:S1-C subfamily serine protease
MVGRVEVDSPADQAGLHGSYQAVTINGQRQLVGGDIITAINGQPVHDINDLQTFIAQAKPGQKAEFTILRDGKQMDVSLTLNRRPQ